MYTQGTVEHLHRSIHRLADAIDGMPEVSAALRRFAGTLPLAAPPTPCGPGPALRPLLYHALDEGVIDAAAFDRLMLLRDRARRGSRAGAVR